VSSRDHNAYMDIDETWQLLWRVQCDADLQARISSCTHMHVLSLSSSSSSSRALRFGLSNEQCLVMFSVDVSHCTTKPSLLGHVEIEWNSNMGEEGLTISPDINLPVSDTHAVLQVIVDPVTQRLVVDTPFSITLRLVNRGSKPLSLRLHEPQVTPGLVCVGRTITVRFPSQVYGLQHSCVHR
jgi:hypothetical protein